VKKALPWIVLVLAALWITRDPAGAADSVQRFLTDLTTFASHL